MKKVKICDHCEKKFHNRQSLMDHLWTFHHVSMRKPVERLLRRLTPFTPVKKEGKPHRKIRMMMCQAKRKKERELVSRKAIKRGIRKPKADSVVH